MSRKVWLLVKWFDDRAIPSHGIVDSNAIIGNKTDLFAGKMICVRSLRAQNDKAAAEIVAISDCKRTLKQKLRILDKKDQELIEIVTAVCYKTMIEMKINFSVAKQPTPHHSRHATRPIPTSSESEETSSSDDFSSLPKRTKSHQQKYKKNCPPYKSSKMNSQIKEKRLKRQRTMSPCVPKKYERVMVDQETQTENILEDNKKVPNHRKTQTDNQPTTSSSVTNSTSSYERILKELYEHIKTMTTEEDDDVSSLVSHSETSGTQPEEQITRNYPNNEQQRTTISSEPGTFERLRTITYTQSGYIGSLAGPSNTHILQPIQETDLNVHNNEQQNVISMEPGTSEPNATEIDTVHGESAETSSSGDSDDMVPIGRGYASVPRSIMDDVNWHSYVSATRQLLQAIFPRKVLATHTITGKKKSSRKTLDENVINDIIETVMEKCSVTRRLVRNCITMKCYDEAVLYRNSQLFNPDKENYPPVSPSSEELSTSS